MHTNPSRGTFEDLFPLLPVPIAHRMATIAYHLRGLVEAVYPDATDGKAVSAIPKPKKNHAEYALGQSPGPGSGKRNAIFGYICPMEKYVRLGFYYDGALPDPSGLLVGEGNRLRHVKLYTLDEAERPEIRALIQAVVQERMSALAAFGFLPVAC